MKTSLYLQPSLLWAKIANKYGNDIRVYVYHNKKPGAWYMHGPKIYWMEEPSSNNGFLTIGQDDLSNNENNIGEIIVSKITKRESYVLGNGIEETINNLKK